MTWLDESVAPLRWLVRIADSHAAVADSGLDLALRHLAGSTRAFLQTYDTRTDPLLRDDAWRRVRHPVVACGLPVEDVETSAAGLREGAARIIHAYSEFQTVSRTFGPAIRVPRGPSSPGPAGLERDAPPSVIRE